MASDATQGTGLTARAASWYAALPSRRRDVAQDTVLALTLALLNLLSLLPYRSQLHPAWLALLLVTGQCLPLALRRVWPVPVLIVTVHSDDQAVQEAIDAGASGYLLKDSPAEELANAVRRVHRGGRAVDPELAREAWTERDPLNTRERQVLRMASDGAHGGDIAATLGLSEGTVRNYLSGAIAKLGAKNRIEAARVAREKGWL